MKQGDLLICVRNNVSNPNWKGIRPKVEEYYICREVFMVNKGGKDWPCCQVEEIINPIELATGKEYPHTQAWYQVVDEGQQISIEQLLTEEITV